MSRLTSGVARAAVVLVLSLAACVDEQDPVVPLEGVRPQAAAGDVYTVTSTNDSGLGTLRWALSYVTGGEVIRFDPALAGKTIVLDSAIEFKKHVTIEGPAGKGIVISGSGNTRHFLLHHTGTVTLRNLTLTGGQAPAGQSGGSMQGLGDVELENVVVYGNRADGISAIIAGDLTLTNSTVSGNISMYGPQGPNSPVKYPPILALDHLIMINSTVAYNTDGGVAGDRLTMRNSIVSNNGNGVNCGNFGFGMVLEGTNIADDDSCGGPTGALIGDPLLAALADNGGPGLTHALLVGSPAINAGTSCNVTVDQRYVTRDAACDLGAFEFIDFTSVALTVDVNVSVNRANGWAVVTGTVQCTRAEPFEVVVTLSQTLKKGRSGPVVQATGVTPVSCGTTARPWSVSLAPSSGSFEVGSADVAVSTQNAPAWVTPASTAATVRLLP